MDSIKNGRNLLAIDVADTVNQLPAKNIDIGFGASAACKGKSEIDVLRFKNECKHFLVALSQKLIEKSPLHKKNCAPSLSPIIMLNSSFRQSRINVALGDLCAYNQISHAEAEKMNRESIDICENSIMQQKLGEFDRTKDTLDAFFIEMLPNDINIFFNFFRENYFGLFSW